jgi:pSer/pThr/pTyr-binding forkhead associated (FHA) protein
MHLILQHCDDEYPEDIEITGSLFAIGRYEPPFGDYDRKKVARLSKRHARIFEEVGRVYVADLGSTNGTFLNGERVQRDPRLLASGDRLGFAGLEYRIEMVEQTARKNDQAEVKLLLTPEVNVDVLEPILISSFPFLINQYNDEFSHHREYLPEALSYISRRHAHFFVRDGTVHIEDLGSTNGTFVCDEPLDEHARPLANGDVVAFGGDQVAYRVQVIDSVAEEQTTLLTEQLDPDRTIIINTPTRFADIYTGNSKHNEPSESEPETEEDSGLVSSSSATTHPARTNLANSLSGDWWAKTRTRWILVVLLLVVVSSTSYWYSSGQTLRELRRLYAEGDYTAVVQASNQFLLEHGASDPIAEIGRDALHNHILPQWMILVESQSYDLALALLERSGELAPGLADPDDSFQLLVWITRTIRLVDAHSTQATLIQQLADAPVIEELFVWWASAEQEHERQLRRLSDLSADYQTVERFARSGWQRLQTISTERAAVAELRSRLDRSLTDRDLAGLDDAILSYTAPVDTTPLLQDVNAMRTVLQLLRDDRPFSAHAAITDSQWQTHLFADHARGLLSTDVPPPEIMAHFQTAKRDWREGETESTRLILATLSTNERWASEPLALRTHYENLLARYRRLSGGQHEPGHGLRLVAYFRLLDPEEDGFLVSLLADDYQIALADERTTSDQMLSRAEQSWSRYHSLGGITEDDRIGPSTSNRFVQLAATLTETRNSLDGAAEVLEMLGDPPTERLSVLVNQVCQEIAFQHSRLERQTDIQGVTTAEGKLTLIPPPCR